MTIFGRSKKKAPNSPPPTQATPVPPNPQTLYLPPQQQWNNIPVRPAIAYAPNPAPGWALSPPPPYQQIFVSNYNILQPPAPERPRKKDEKKNTLPSMSVGNLPAILTGDMPSFIPGAHIFNDGAHAFQPQIPQAIQYLTQGVSLHDLISSRFNTVVTQIDSEKFSGDESELWVHQPPSPQWHPSSPDMAVVKHKGKEPKTGSIEATKSPAGAAITSTNYFSKVNHYANSKLPHDLPPVKL